MFTLPLYEARGIFASAAIENNWLAEECVKICGELEKKGKFFALVDMDEIMEEAKGRV